MVVHLFDTVTATPTQDSGGGYNVGTAFNVTNDCNLLGVRFYATLLSGLPRGKPSRIGVWRISDQALIANVQPVPDNTGAGWTDITFTAPVPLDHTQSYIVAGLWPESPGGYYAVGYPSTQPTGATYLGSPERYASSASWTYPANNASTNFYAVDVILDVTAAADQPVTVGDLPSASSATLAQWLSTNPGTNTHQSDGWPAVTGAAVAGLTAIVGARGSGETRTIWSILVTLAAAAINHAEGIANVLSWFGGAAKPTSQDALATILNRLDVRVEDTQTKVDSLLARGATPTGFPVGYTLQDTTTFNGALAWPVGADLYTVTFDTVPPELSAGDVAGIDYRPRLAWWARLNGDFVLSERRFVDFPMSHLWDQGQRMPGLALYCPRGGAGTVEAWTYTG